MRAGLKLWLDARRFDKLAAPVPGERVTERRTRILGFKGDQTFRDYLGPLHPEAETLLTPISRRTTAELEEISAGSVISLFAHVFSSGTSTLGQNLQGGPSRLPESLAERLGERVETGARVTEVHHDGHGVTIDYERGGERKRLRARCAIVTATAPHAKSMLVDAPADLRAALGSITYGPMVVGDPHERTAPMPWDDMYSIIAPGRSFTMVFNHGNALRPPGEARRPGGALMVYAGARLALDLWDRTDEQVAETYCRDLYEVFPAARGVVAEVIVQRWRHTVPFAAPGRHRVQETLERGMDRIFLAGDYVGDWVQMEASAETAIEAAQRVRSTLAGSPVRA